MEINVIQKAVSNFDGITKLVLDGVGCPSIEFSKHNNGIEVESIRIDTLVEHSGIPCPDYAVIDAEGAELAVLSGMVKTLRKRKTTILVEVHWLGDKFLEFFEEIIKPLGYTIENLTGEEMPSEPIRWHALLKPIA